jgi:hypothetical protein
MTSWKTPTYRNDRAIRHDARKEGQTISTAAAETFADRTVNDSR